ncbi:MAG TPA: right-handed parallel beta-helix repeat-containing protein [Myxococcota bacterium]|nr:right-handed parallel beta-helix repeat-containing protein [Myxococcota bacterium]
MSRPARARRGVLHAVAAFSIATLGLGSTASALDFDVNSTSDTTDATPGDGLCSTGGTVNDPVLGLVPECTLRAAIQEANAWSGRDRITFTSTLPFNGLTGVAFIMPGSGYPAIVDELEIDGTTAASWVSGGYPKVQLRGQAFFDGLRLGTGSGSSTIKGLAFQGFDTGIRLESSDGAWIDACAFGHFSSPPPFGSESVVANTRGIDVRAGATGTRIGRRTQAGGFVGEGNVVSGNVYGIRNEGPATRIVGNFVGTDRSGERIRTATTIPLVDLGNVYGIEVVNGSDLEIGDVLFEPLPAPGSFVAEGNVISGNATGVWLHESAARTGADPVIRANRIGTDDGGETALGNTTAGILFSSANGDVTIGGLFAPNVISGNAGNGIDIQRGSTLGGVSITSNRIGVGLDELTPIPNTGNGIAVEDGDPVTISLNVIGANELDGILVQDPPGFDDVGHVEILDNWIGVNKDSARIGNVGAGVRVEHFDVLIDGNRIGANDYGIELGEASEDVVVTSNWLGTDGTGADLGNAQAGLRSQSPLGGHVIGLVGQGNVVGWNGTNGITMNNSSTVNELIGNFVGVSDTNQPMPNGRHGISVRDNYGGSTPVVIGSRLVTPAADFEGRENRIGYNVEDAISISPDAWALIRANRMRLNGDLAIDLDNDGATPNDVGDLDLGANWLQNSPEMDAAASALDPVTGELEIEYRVRSNTTESNYDLTIDFYLADATGLQPDRYLGSDVYIAADANLQRTVQFPPVVALDPFELHSIVATATDASGHTSEVGAPIVVPEPGLAASIVLGALGLCGAAGTRRRRSA